MSGFKILSPPDRHAMVSGHTGEGMNNIFHFFTLIKFIKNRTVFNILRGISVLVISLFIIFTGISLYKDYYLKKNMIDPNNYYLNQKNKKIYYRIYDGYFDYKIKDGELKYSIYMAGDGVPFPYCDYLMVKNQKPMISLEIFCNYYNYKYSVDEKNKLTIINLENDIIMLYWNTYFAEYEKSGKKIEFETPVIYRISDDKYYQTSAPGPYTFVSISFLQEAGLLK